MFEVSEKASEVIKQFLQGQQEPPVHQTLDD